MTVEPGRQLAGRYRVEDLLAERAGARLWRAVDEVLRRSVAIDVLPSSAPRASALVQAARRSAVVTDGRFLRVLDAAEENGDVYVVREWAPGESLDLVLADGPLTHRRAAWIVHEVAEAVSVAHSAGIYHLRLVPQNVLVTDTGGVKIIGLATDAALHGVKHADAEAEDVRGLGRLLYASVVARWPGGPQCNLPPAPVEHARLLRPGQVRAGVPRVVDDVCDRILGEPPRHQAEPLRHASAVAAELDATVRLATDAPVHHDPDLTQAAGIPAFGGGVEHTTHLAVPEDDEPIAPPRSLRAERHQSVNDGSTASQPAVPAAGDSAARSGPDTASPGRSGAAGPDTAAYPPPRAGAPDRAHTGAHTTRQIPATTAPIAASRPDSGTSAPPPPPPAQAGEPDRFEDERDRKGGLVWLGVVAAILVLAAISFFLGMNTGADRSNRAGGPSATPNSTTPASNSIEPVNVASVSTWDPFGEAGENDEAAPLVLDGDPSTQWTTLSYEGDPRFGGLKPGLGLVLDLGSPTEVSRVTLRLDGSGTDLKLRATAPNASELPARPGGLRTVASAEDASGRTVLQLEQPATTRYLVVWLTELPPEDGAATFRGEIGEITVEG